MDRFTEELAKAGVLVAAAGLKNSAQAKRIVCDGDRLRVVAPSPVVNLNRAIAHSMAFGPEAGLRLVDEIADALRVYAPLPAARGDFLFRAGRLAEARSEFTAAATLTRNARERAFLLARANACDAGA
jgi:predicted RNA polymerase sigma factor